MTLHVALVSAYLTEAEARAALAGNLSAEPAEYRGVWRMPTPYGSLVHLFSDDGAEDLAAQGMSPVVSSKGDTRKATWVRTVRALRRLAERLRGHGFTVTEPADLDVHPDFRDQG